MLDACIPEIESAMGRPMTADERARLREDMDQLIADYRNSDFTVDFDETRKRFAASKKVDAYLQARNKMLNKARVAEMVDYLETSFSDDPGKGLIAILSGITSAKKGSRRSVSASQKAIFNHHAMGLMADLESEGVDQLFKSGALDADIYVAMHRIDRNMDMDGVNPDAVKVAKIIRKYNESLRRYANEYGADISKLDGWVMRRSHNKQKISADKEGWINFMLDKLDMARTFGRDGPVDMTEIRRALDNLYTGFASGVHLKTAGQAEVTGLGISNIGKRLGRERVLHFKTPEAEFEYNQQFGNGRLAEGVLLGIEKLAGDIGVMQRLGPNAEKNLNDAIEQVKRKLRDRGETEKLQDFSASSDKTMRVLWKHVNGEARIPENDTLAAYSGFMRALQQVSKLGGAVLSAFSDLGFYASEVRYQGGSTLGGLAESVESLAGRVPKKDRARLLSNLGVMYDSMLGSYTSRFDAADTMPGRTSAMVNLFFRVNGLTWWTDSLRSGFALARSHDLAQVSSRAWSDLGEDLTRALGLFGIDEGRWSIVRQAVETADDGKQFVTAQAINTLDDDVFRQYLEAAGLKASPARIRETRRELFDQVASYFQDRATTAVLEPDTRTRAILMQGQRPGTVTGELLSHLVLFKSFPAAVIQKIVAREVYGRGANTVAEALRNRNGEMVGLAHLIVTTTALGYLSMTAKDLAKNRTPRDPEDYRTWLAAATQGGGLGIFGDFLFGDMKNRYGGGAISTLAGPTAGTAESIVDIFQRARDGDDTAAQAYRVILNNTPFINLFYTRAAMDYLILNDIAEQLSPGYMRRMEKRLQKENEQGFLFPPS